MIVGGWEFIIAAYSITWLVLGGYAFSIWRRSRALCRREKEPT